MEKENITPEKLSRFGYLPRMVGSIEAESKNHLKVNIRSTNEPILTRRKKKVRKEKRKKNQQKNSANYNATVQSFFCN